MFILGSNKNLYIAREGALKIKEITYIHCESYSIGQLKHGPLALISKNFPVVYLFLNENKIILINLDLLWPRLNRDYL